MEPGCSAPLDAGARLGLAHDLLGEALAEADREGAGDEERELARARLGDLDLVEQPALNGEVEQQREDRPDVRARRRPRFDRYSRPNSWLTSKLPPLMRMRTLMIAPERTGDQAAHEQRRVDRRGLRGRR